MKKHLLALLLIAFWNNLVFGQVNVGVNTKTPATSAILEINSKLSTENGYRGFLPPRINLQNLSDQSTISTPADGLMVYNINPSLDVTLAFWNQSITKWEFTKYYLKTPKIATVVYNNANTVDVLTTAPAGYRSSIKNASTNFVIESDGGINGLSINTSTSWTDSQGITHAVDKVIVPSGKYLIQFSITLKANSPANTTISPLNGNPYSIKSLNSLTYYNMGYFMDLTPYSYAGTTFTNTSPVRFRTESAILSPSDNSEHNLIFLYFLDSSALNITTPYFAFDFVIGRMQGSSYFGKSSVVTSKTKLKITKLL